MKRAFMVGTLTLIFTLFIVACQEENDSDSNTYEFEDCIPTSVSNDDRAALRIIMKLIVGEYKDSDGRKNVITCNAEDAWETPPQGNYMDTYWNIPLRVAVAGVFEEIVGHLELDVLPPKDKVQNSTYIFYFEIGEEFYRAHNEQVDEQTMRWVFTSLDEELTWTKTNP